MARSDRTVGVDSTRARPLLLHFFPTPGFPSPPPVTTLPTGACEPYGIAGVRWRQPPRSSRPRRWSGSSASGCWTRSSPSRSASGRSSPSATSAGMRRAAPSSKVSLSPGFTVSALLLFQAWLKALAACGLVLATGATDFWSLLLSRTNRLDAVDTVLWFTNLVP